MIYRGPGFLAVVWFGSSTTPSPSPVTKLSLFLSLPVCHWSINFPWPTASLPTLSPCTLYNVQPYLSFNISSNDRHTVCACQSNDEIFHQFTFILWFVCVSAWKTRPMNLKVLIFHRLALSYLIQTKCSVMPCSANFAGFSLHDEISAVFCVQGTVCKVLSAQPSVSFFLNLSCCWACQRKVS